MDQTNPVDSVSSEKVICAECGNAFPKSDVLSFGKFSICANCKPIYQQKLSEGAAAMGNREFSSARRRAAALMVDSIISWVLMLVIGLPFAGFGFKGVMTFIQSGSVTLISTILGIGYYVFFIGKYGATPGKMAMGIKVIRANGKSVGYGLATGRYFAQFVNAFTFGIGYLMAVWDKEKRGLHDRICGTRVIKT